MSLPQKSLQRIVKKMKRDQTTTRRMILNLLKIFGMMDHAMRKRIQELKMKKMKRLTMMDGDVFS
jgi:hypothetical protein